MPMPIEARPVMAPAPTEALALGLVLLVLLVPVEPVVPAT